MPFIDPKTGEPVAPGAPIPVDVPSAISPEVHQPEDPGWGGEQGALESSYRMDNTLGANDPNTTLLSPMNQFFGYGPNNEPEEGFSPWEDIKGTEFEEYWDRF